MGLCASYYAVTAKELEHYLTKDNAEDIFEDLEEISDSEDESCYTDLDKLWDGLHFLLTGYDSDNDFNAEKSPQNLALYHAFFGQNLITSTEKDTQMFYIPVENVPHIADVLNTLNFNDFTKNVDFNKFSEKEIYPDIWCEEDHDELLEELEEYFDRLKDFYQNAKENNFAVITFVG